MRIAQVAPLFESVPPRCYGGTERVVHYLTEELVKRGHEVTLYASGDSETSAELVACVPKALRLHATYDDPSAFEVIALERLLQDAARFDVIHFHTGYLHCPLVRRMGVPSVTTKHGRLDTPELAALFAAFDDVPLVSISDSQRAPAPHVNWQATIYHGLPADLYALRETPQDYFAFLGRISPEKRVDRAIEIAKAVGAPLRIAAKVDRADREYYEAVVRPLLNDPLVQFVGDIDDAGKQELVGGARALLFPIDWPEPFGLAMIEAMACGTPVIAWRNGSVPEVVTDGVSGFIVDSMEEAIAAARRIDQIDRRGCRACFEGRFLASRMADEYEIIYRRLVLERRAEASPRADQRSLVGA
ncbi:MAG TPA: glycosyltransferase family 4 protein [Phycisphaerales bacterium]|nr:glycosyltransferase family 4 protein [Phycisphaerales bacterium]